MENIQCKKRFFPRGFKFWKRKRIISGSVFHDDWICPACKGVLTFVHGNKNIGNCSTCHTNWTRNMTQREVDILNEI